MRDVKEFPELPVVKIQCFHSWGMGSIPGWRTEILQATQCNQRK